MATGKGFKITNFALDKRAEKEGIWIDVGAGLELRIARISSPDFEEYMRKHSRVNPTRFRPLVASNTAVDEEATMRGVARYILLDWRNLQDEKDQPIVYSEATAYKLLNEYPEFYKLVLGYSMEYDGYRLAEQETAAKNLPLQSSGTSTGQKT